MHFRERPWDLFLSEGYVVAVALFIIGTGQGVLGSVALLFIVPGYLLLAVLYPADGEISWLERVALSFVLSLAVVPLLALFLNFTPFGIRLLPLTLTLLAFSAGMGAAAYVRRTRLPVERRLSATVHLRWPAWRETSIAEKGLAVGLALSLILAGAVLAYVATTPRPGDRFTEFYLLSAGGTAEGYPTSLGVAEEGTVLIAVANHEFASVNYTIRMDLVGVEAVWNETGGFGEVRELNRTNLAWFYMTLDHGANWTRSYSFQINAPGEWQVQLSLFRDGNLDTSYRYLHLFVTVGAE